MDDPCESIYVRVLNIRDTMTILCRCDSSRRVRSGVYEIKSFHSFKFSSLMTLEHKTNFQIECAQSLRAHMHFVYLSFSDVRSIAALVPCKRINNRHF